MSQTIEGPRKTYLASAAIGANLRVKISDATTSPPTVSVAGASDPSTGVTEAAVLAAGPVSILLANAQGTKKMSASEAITGGNSVYAAAAGQVASTGTVVEGEAQETTTADGDIFEVLGTHNSDISTAISGTTAVGFEVDTDSSTPKIKLLSVAAGTGDFTTTLTPEAALSGDNTITVPESDGDTLAALALAQSFTADQTYGVDATGIDCIWYGDTTGSSMTWDSSDDALEFTDDTPIKFGDGGDILLQFDATDLVFTSAVADTGGVNFGVDDAGVDVILYGDTASQSLTWDQSADDLIATSLVRIVGAGSTQVPLMPVSAQQSLSGAGVANITSYYTALTNTGADAISLAGGAQSGQLKKIQMIVDPGTDSTLTPAPLTGGTTITFADVGDYCILMWSGTSWVPIELGNDADGVSGPAIA